MNEVKPVSKTKTKLFNSFKEYTDYLNAIPIHDLSVPFTTKDVKQEIELIEKYGIQKKTIIVAQIGEKKYRVFGNDTVQALNEANTELLEEGAANHTLVVTVLEKEEHIKGLIEGVKIQYSFS